MDMKLSLLLKDGSIYDLVLEESVAKDMFNNIIEADKDMQSPIVLDSGNGEGCYFSRDSIQIAGLTHIKEEDADE